MPYHNPNSRSRRNVLRIVGVLVVLAVIAGVANFLHATTSIVFCSFAFFFSLTGSTVFKA